MKTRCRRLDVVGGSWPFDSFPLYPRTFVGGRDGDPASEYHRADRYRLPLCFLSASSPSALPVCPPSVILTDHNSNVNVTPSRAAVTKARLPGSLPTRGIHRVRGTTQHACRRKTTEIMQPSLELSSSSSVRPRWPDPRPLTPRPGPVARIG